MLPVLNCNNNNNDTVTVVNLLENTNVMVSIISGDLDLICDTPGELVATPQYVSVYTLQQLRTRAATKLYLTVSRKQFIYSAKSVV